jgi:hypothetical protein
VHHQLETASLDEMREDSQECTLEIETPLQQNKKKYQSGPEQNVFDSVHNAQQEQKLPLQNVLNSESAHIALLQKLALLITFLREFHPLAKRLIPINNLLFVTSMPGGAIETSAPIKPYSPH